MKGSALREIIERDPILVHHFQGIFARDTLPSLGWQQCFAIVNTQNENERGLHWQLCIRPERQILELYDPLGWKSENENLFVSSRVLEGISKVVIPETQFQPSTSQKCGLYCIYVAHHRIYNLDVSLTGLLSDIFTDNLVENDKIVTDFINSLSSY